jgi:hypothetical protein
MGYKNSKTFRFHQKHRNNNWDLYNKRGIRIAYKQDSIPNY